MKSDDLHDIVLRGASGNGGLIRSRGRDNAVEQADRRSAGIIGLTLDGPAAGGTRTESIRGFRGRPGKQIFVGRRGGDCGRRPGGGSRE